MLPLVSVIMPCHNAKATLPQALASLIAQTHQGWECIIVDDGSTDGSFQWLERLTDPRFRCFRSAENRGRGAARQFALDHAEGRYLAILDADDWYYPQKLGDQVQRIESAPKLAFVTAGMAVVDRNNRLAGARRAAGSCVSSARANGVDVPFAPSLIRMELAKRIGFNPAYRVAEDWDFLARLLPDRSYEYTSELKYAYSEFANLTLDKLLLCNRGVQQKAVSQHAQNRLMGQLVRRSYDAKALLYRVAFALGQQDRVVRARSIEPSQCEVEEFEVARTTVERVMQRYFE